MRSTLGQLDYKSRLGEAIDALKRARNASENWASGVCHKKGDKSAWVRCGTSSSQKDREKCCVNSEAPYPAGVKAAVRILHGIKKQATADPAIGAPFLGGYKTLEGYFGSPDNGWNDSRYQSGSWEDTIRVLDSALIDLKTAQGGSGFTTIVIVTVAICIVGAVFYYFHG